MIEKQINPHDKFFKEVFLRKEEVKSFIQNFLPKEIVKNIKFDTLKVDKDSYIDEELKENFADIVYTCLYGDLDSAQQPTEIKITLLFEHKSYQDDDINLQLLQYMINIWRNDRGEKKKNKKVKRYKLIPILPIVIYNGRKEWKYKQFYEYFKDIPSELIRFVPNFDYLIQDLHKISHEEIVKKYQSIILQSSFLVMKDIFDTLALLENISNIFKKIYSIDDINYDKRFVIALFHYLYYTNSDENYVILKEKVKQLPKTNVDMITIAESLIKQGEEKGFIKGQQDGIQKGRQEGDERTACVMLLEEFDLEIIQRSTKLEMKRILELQELVKKQGSAILDDFNG